MSKCQRIGLNTASIKLDRNCIWWCAVYWPIPREHLMRCSSPGPCSACPCSWRRIQENKVQCQLNWLISLPLLILITLRWLIELMWILPINYKVFPFSEDWTWSTIDIENYCWSVP